MTVGKGWKFSKDVQATEDDLSKHRRNPLMDAQAVTSIKYNNAWLWIIFDPGSTSSFFSRLRSRGFSSFDVDCLATMTPSTADWLDTGPTLSSLSRLKSRGFSPFDVDCFDAMMMCTADWLAGQDSGGTLLPATATTMYGAQTLLKRLKSDFVPIYSIYSTL